MLSLHTGTSSRGATVQPRSAELAGVYTEGLAHIPDKRTPSRDSLPQLQPVAFEQFVSNDMKPCSKVKPGVGVMLADIVFVSLLETDDEDEAVRVPVMEAFDVTDADRVGVRLF